MDGEGKANTEDKLRIGTSSAVLLLALPWLSMCVWGFSYSAASLHYRSSGWEIWRLGAVGFASYACRPCVNVLFTAVSSWVAAPLSVAVAVLVIPAAVYPDAELAVTMELLVEWGFLVELALQGLCFSAFGHSKGLLLQASRVQMLSGTLGYAMSPFIGGVLYDLGGWQACAGFHLAIQSLMAVLLCSSPFVVSDWKRWKARRIEGHSREPAVESESGEPAKSGSGCCSGGLSAVAVKSCPLLPREIRLPCLAVAVATFGNAFCYQCEWSTYALYFREEHNWTFGAFLS